MICALITGPTFEVAYQQMAKALLSADLVELRLDCFVLGDLTELALLRSHFSIPMIFTLRSQLHGGSYRESEEKRIADIRRLLALKPEYIDLEEDISPLLLEEIITGHTDIKLILSYHHFQETPKNLEAIYQKMQRIPAYFYKIAVMAKNSLDTLRLLSWAKESERKVIAISMGGYGQISRILAPMIGSPITYALLEEDPSSPLGQLSVNRLKIQYHYYSLTPYTSLYALIGDPIGLSISDKSHNSFIRAYGLEALYIKIEVKIEELFEFLQLAKGIFHGMSVTMPLKESILPFLDKIDSQALKVGAVNTILFKQGEVCGFNTDGIGALNVIEKGYSVKGKRLVIIGAGGASRAIAYEAHKRGAHVTLLNRNIEKAEEVARPLRGVGKGIGYMESCFKTGYDILINATSHTLPIEEGYILPQAIVMDLRTYPKESLFLKAAREKGCRIIYGYQMFIEQALGQFNLWFKNRFDHQEARKILEESFQQRELDRERDQEEYTLGSQRDHLPLISLQQ